MKRPFGSVVLVAVLVCAGCADSDQDAANRLAIQQAQAQAEEERSQLAEISDLSGKCQRLDLAACDQLSDKVCAIDDEETCSSAKALEACQALRAAARAPGTARLER
jgi:hypothetical protein